MEAVHVLAIAASECSIDDDPLLRHIVRGLVSGGPCPETSKDQDSDRPKYRRRPNEFGKVKFLVRKSLVEGAWSPLDRAAGFLSQARLDYASFLEEVQGAPPVAFADRGGLQDWISCFSSRPAVEPFGTGGHALRVHGWLRNGGYFEQIWARARYGSYRDLMLSVARRSYDEDLAGVDADHVIARTILTDAPEAWVAIFPVYSSSNRGFGRIERLMPKFDPADRLARLTPAAAFKIFNGRMVSTTAELELAMADIRGQIVRTSTFLDDFISRMHSDLVPFVHQAG